MAENGRTAIVTGAGKRVGAEIALALLEDGWTVVAHVHRDQDAIPDGSIKVVADLADPGSADAIFAAAVGRPPVRLLVNNAARFAWDSLDGFQADELAMHMAVNVQAPVSLSRRFARDHAPGEDALIVNLLDSKLVEPNPDYLSYTLSKNALAAFTDLAARALAGKGIRVNGVAPGLMLQSSGQTEANFRAMHSDNPLRRGVEPRDVVDAIRYLAGARCVTGQMLVIDSGHRFMRLDRDVQFLEEQ